ncbi:MAG TPA: hypothetical protein VH760_12375 [Gaiellaceae bacterium]|jgi:hypothetical protein
MSTDSTIHTTSVPTPPAPASYYCSCAIPLAVERAERHGAAMRICARCELPIAVSLRRW